ncbi:MAG TPA: alkaline phosphatase family protein [Elusimicrobiota bacterium]|nr:alkaline phosphatase family protein [Elusimicrobiota bacterium]
MRSVIRARSLFSLFDGRIAIPLGVASWLCFAAVSPCPAEDVNRSSSPAAALQTHPRKSPKIILIGVDGLAPDYLERWSRQGRLPCLSRLMKNGSYYKTNVDIGIGFSPAIWTSILTGQRPEKHGITIDSFKDIPSGARQSKALWNIFGDFGLRVASVGHLVTWPAEHVNGVMLSRHYLQETVPGRLYPEELSAPITKYLSDRQSEVEGVFYRFRRYLQPSGKKQPEGDPVRAVYEKEKGTDIETLRAVLRDDTNNYLTSVFLLRDNDYDFFTVYFGGCDQVAHRFLRYENPEDYIPAPDAAAYGKVLLDYYRLIDGWIESLLRFAGPDTMIVVCSDHGLRKKYPMTEARLGQGKVPGSHDLTGVFIVSGPDVKKGYYSRADILDIAPTLLYKMGLSIAADLDGRVLSDCFENNYRFTHPVVLTDTYGPPVHQPCDFPVKNLASEGELQKLKALGYLK